MSEFKTKYDNPISVTGLKIIEPTPVDDRLLVDSEDALKQLFVAPLSVEELNFIATLYDGLVTLTGDSTKQYIWTESDYGLLSTSYTYPAYATNIAGQDYAGKTFNFVLFDKTARVVITYTNPGDAGLTVAAGLLPYHILKDMSTAMVTMKSSTSGYLEIEHPDSITFTTSSITIILDPKPDVGEQFRITIY
jgi:hypothetical protein